MKTSEAILKGGEIPSLSCGDKSAVVFYEEYGVSCYSLEIFDDFPRDVIAGMFAAIGD